MYPYFKALLQARQKKTYSKAYIYIPYFLLVNGVCLE